MAEAAPLPHTPGHVSRHDNQSVSSTHSAGSRSSRSKGNVSVASPAVESAVTRLLVSIKALLEALTLWSELKQTENEVSDVYVRLGNDFNAAVQAFATFHIEMTELLSVPDDLRIVLEECLAEDANPNNLNRYLPTVRSIITNLLQGLRGKQSLYRQMANQSRHRSTASSNGTDRDSRVSSKSGHSRASSSRASAPDSPPTNGQTRRSATAPSSRSSKQQRPLPEGVPPPPPPGPAQMEEPPRFVGGFLPPGVMPNGNRSPSTPPPSAPFPPVPSVDLSSPIRSRPSTPVTHNDIVVPLETTPTQAPVVQKAPASLKRYSLVDKPVGSPPAVIVDTPSDDTIDARAVSPPPEPAQFAAIQTPAMQSSLDALKTSKVVRRASTRFSTYQMKQISGGSMRSSPGTSSSAPHRRSLAASNALTPSDLAALAEADENEESEEPFSNASLVRSRSKSKSPIPPMPPLPEAVSRSVTPTKTASAPPPTIITDTAPPDGPFPVFLQVGREVKKVSLEPGFTFGSLRMLFLDKFSYNPGKENFPAIYMRDPASGVQYELEDVDEIKEKCLLMLNIEPLDQIKQHIDVQIASLAQDIKDLKSSVTSNRRQSYQPAGESSFMMESTPIAPRPTDKQLANAARRISRFVHPGEGRSSTPPPMPPQMTGASVLPQMTGASVLAQMTGVSLFPQMTGGSVMSEYTSRVVTDLRTQFDEVQNLRRDLGVMRQLYTEFVKQTKDSLGSLRGQAQSVRQLASTNIGGARAYIVSGKTNIDTRSQDVLTRMEELQDLVETVKDDVLKRHIVPKPALMKSIRDDVTAVSTELKALEDHISTVRPMWKKTWEEELQNIVEEQQFLQHQEEFLGDLQEDQKAVLEVFGHVEKVIALRKSTPGRKSKGGPRFPPVAEEGEGTRDNVLMEIRAAAIDPNRRMKAIAANQKNRERELAAQSDEFERELTDFVGGNKLKKTGGAEEVERLRQKRNDQTLQAMFTGDSTLSINDAT